MSRVLTIEDLAVSFDGVTALEKINLSLDSGDSLAIVGPNGAGKSVFIHTLLGTVPYSGKVEWAKDVRIGYVPQKIDADRHLPINFENLLAAKASVLKLSKEDIAKTIETVSVGEKILTTPVGHLSGGQFQRALIAFALLGKPNVLILDEPTASIDKPGEEQIYELVHRLQDEYKMTVILVSHDLSFVYRYSNRVLCLNKTAICFGTPEEALTPENLEHLYGGRMKYYHSVHDHEGARGHGDKK